MAEPIKWPQYRYNAKGEVRVCDNKEQLEKAKTTGFTATNYVKQSFPTVVYGKDGVTALATSEQDLEDKIKEGWSQEHIPAKKETPQALGVPSGQTANDETMKLLMGLITETREKIEALEAQNEQFARTLDLIVSKLPEDEADKPAAKGKKTA